MRSIPCCIATVLVTTVTAFAAHREVEELHYSQIPAGEVISKVVGCKSGELLSGGYRLDNAPIASVDIVVFSSHASTETTWLVEARNVSSRAVSGTLFVTVICS
jgi:hypothetical protein